MPIDLFCFPYAGASSTMFFRWRNFMPAEINLRAIEYPGRGPRFREPLLTSFDDLVVDAIEQIKSHLHSPFAFYGHSLGGLVSFEVIRRLRSIELPQPFYLCVSGRNAPQLQRPFAPISQLPDDSFLREMKRLYQGIPEQVEAVPELLQLFLPILKADMVIFEGYKYVTAPPLSCPITAIGGMSDPLVSEDRLQPWRDQTTAKFTLRMLPGGHFTMLTQPHALIQQILDDISSFK
jgi:medium-chain acyl-[acyl-carrier-protein] hydrolase